MAPPRQRRWHRLQLAGKRVLTEVVTFDWSFSSNFTWVPGGEAWDLQHGRGAN